MLNVRDLEARHRKYKLKSYIPYIVAFSGLTIITISALVLTQKNQNSDDTTYIAVVEKKPTIKESTRAEIKDTSIVEKKTVSVKDIQNRPIVALKEDTVKTKLSLAPSMGFMKKIESNTIANYEAEKTNIRTDSTKVEKKVKNINKPVIKKTIKAIEPVKIERKVINIDRKKDNQDIQHVIKRFKNNNSPALSLFIAKKYYKIGEYHKAYNYALITNEINNDIEDSWIIFAKSLIKLKEKDMAIKTLKKYISSSHSSQAKILLDEILSGKFR